MVSRDVFDDVLMQCEECGDQWYVRELLDDAWFVCPSCGGVVHQVEARS